MRTDYLALDQLEVLLGGLMPANRAALEISMCTGLRISDVLALRWEKCCSLQPGDCFTLVALKTGRPVNVLVTPTFCNALKRAGGGSVHQKGWVFPGRTQGTNRPSAGESDGGHRTRQAVWKDLKRAARLYRCEGRRLRENVGPHSCRKVFAVRLYQESKSLEVVRRALGHKDLAVTMLYALADELTARERSVTSEAGEFTPVEK